MKRLFAVLLLILLTSCTATRAAAPGMVDSISALPERVGTVAQPPDPATPMVVLYSDGTWRCMDGGLDCVGATATAMPAPIATLIPTNTPRPTATALLTPIATETPPETPTLEDAQTPTSTPLPSPQPSLTPTPPLGRCVLVVATAVLNIRAFPWGAVLGQTARGDSLSPDGLTTAGDGSRWYQVYGTPEIVQGYVYAGLVAPKEGTDCSGVPEVTP